MSPENVRRPTDEEKRLMLLYIIGHAGQLSDMQLLQLLFENDLMNYFDMMLTLNDLVSQGQCVRTPVLGKTLYSLTAAGREALELFSRIIPASVREKLDTVLPYWTERFRTEQEYPASWRQTRRGEYVLDMGINEQNMALLRITLSLPSEDMARTLGEAWPGQAGNVYSTLLSPLKTRTDSGGAGNAPEGGAQ